MLVKRCISVYIFGGAISPLSLWDLPYQVSSPQPIFHDLRRLSHPGESDTWTVSAWACVPGNGQRPPIGGGGVPLQSGRRLSRRPGRSGHKSNSAHQGNFAWASGMSLEHYQACTAFLETHTLPYYPPWRQYIAGNPWPFWPARSPISGP